MEKKREKVEANAPPKIKSLDLISMQFRWSRGAVLCEIMLEDWVDVPG
jgi:hypothetical protein